MRLRRINFTRYERVATAVFCLSIISSPAQANPFATAFERAEVQYMKRLADVQNATPGKLKKFSTDGCSGGLSASWELLASIVPKLNNKIGAQPPWLNCCTVHDRVYWKGETENGFQKRLDADEQLRACVVATGQRASVAIAVKWRKPREEVEERFNWAAAMMYQAVRLGGQPCSGLSWRWGYGWPLCSEVGKSVEP